MDKEFIIYKVSNKINKKVYIGQTTVSLKERKRSHIMSSKKENCTCKFHLALKEIGIENFKWKVIDKCNSIQELNQKEIYWIEYYDSINNGYNSKGGGSNGFLTKEIKNKISEAQKGSKNHMYGKTGKMNSTSRPVKNLNTGKIYESIMLCAKEENASNSRIGAVCKGHRATYRGNVYRYIDENNKIIEPEKTIKSKSKKVINLDTGEIFDSCKSAYIKYKLPHQNDIRALSQKLRKNNGKCNWNNYKWSYYNEE